MPADTKKQGLLVRPATALSATGLPALIGDAGAPVADTSLSAAFKNVLGAKPGEAHLAVPSLPTGAGIAKLAKAEKPNAPLKTAPRKAHIGPRSGHK